MTKVGVRLEKYLFRYEGFPKKSEIAIKDSECMNIAREIINLEAIYNLENRNSNSKDKHLLQHFEKMRDYFVEQFGDDSSMVEHLQEEIDVCKTGLRKYSHGHSYYDDILRIRAVFDLYE